MVTRAADQRKKVYENIFAPTDGFIAPLQPMFYLTVKIRRTIVQPLIDSGASDNFISVATAKKLNLRLYELHEGQSFIAADGKQLPCKYFCQSLDANPDQQGKIKLAGSAQTGTDAPRFNFGSTLLTKAQPGHRLECPNVNVRA